MYLEISLHISVCSFSLASSFLKSSKLVLFLIGVYLPGDQEGLFKLAVLLRIFFNSVIYNTATGYVLLVYLTNI
jgi:hypothetical protein